MKGYGIYIKNDLLEKKHRKAIGSAVWEYLWCIDKMTSISEDRIGRVLGGKPVRLKEIKKDLGTSDQSISRNLHKLKREGYLILTHAPYGIIICINKASKKFGRKMNDNYEKIAKSFKTAVKEKMSNDRSGSKCYNWKGGISSDNTIARHSYKYRDWRGKVFGRDKYSCIECGQEGGDIEAHHIVGFSEDKKKRYAVDNGVTLCKKCHANIHRGLNKKTGGLNKSLNLYRHTKDNTIKALNKRKKKLVDKLSFNRT